MESRNSQLYSLLDYPRQEPERGRELYRELSNLGVTELEFASKGYRGVVFKAYFKGRPVAVKVKRSDVRKDSPIEKEYSFLKHLFELYGDETPAPVPFFYTKDFLVMEWVSGKSFAEAFKEEPFKVVREALISCYKLDVAKVEHTEIKGNKHLIYTGSRVKIIDFESARFKEKPRNLLQFVGYHLIGRKLFKELSLKEEELRMALELYKKEPDRGLEALFKLLGF
jgi:putative serine/threonine protein kinase